MKYVRDGLYGYIAITPIEDVILNDPAVYRLHRILQNSTFFHTFPYNRGSRFIHSLGAMHIAGKMCFRLFQNSEEELSIEIVNAIKTFLSQKEVRPEELRQAHRYLLNIQKPTSNLMQDSPSSFYRSYGWPVSRKLHTGAKFNYREIDNNFIRNLIYQAVRIAALVHDIGHPPYSHVVEFALNDMVTYQEEAQRTKSKPPSQKPHRSVRGLSFSSAVKKLDNEYYGAIIYKLNLLFSKDEKPFKKAILRGKLHEKVGLALLNRIIRSSRPSGDREEEFTAFFDICLQLAELIIAIDQLGHFNTVPFLLAANQNRLIRKLFPLANIISGSVDCDRLDYIVRDAETSGVPDFHSFDQARIIQNLCLVKKHIGKSQDYIIVPAFHRRAYSALVDFFLAKLKAHRWLIGHQSVVRTDIALNRTSLKLARVHENVLNDKFFPIESPAVEFLGEFFRKHPFQPFLELSSENYRYIDDAWLDTYLQTLHRELRRKKIGGAETLPRMLLYLRVLLERETKGMKAVWKREYQFLNFAQGFVEVFRKNWQPEVNIRKPFQGPTVVRDLKVLMDQNANPIVLTNQILQIWVEKVVLLQSPYTSLIPIERELKAKWGDIVFSLKSYSPYQQTLLVGDDKSEILPLEETSDFIRDIKNYSQGQLLLYAYDLSNSDRPWTSEDIKQLGREVAEIVISDKFSGDSIASDR